MKHTFEEVCAVLDSERDYQDQRWPDHMHPVGSYLTYIWRYYRVAEELDSTTDALSGQALVPLRKLAALAVVCMEQNGLGEGYFASMLPSRENVYFALQKEMKNLNMSPDSGRPLEVSEELTAIRIRLEHADKNWDPTYRPDPVLRWIRSIGALAIRCMQNHGAPPRDLRLMPVNSLAVAEAAGNDPTPISDPTASGGGESNPVPYPPS
jgi:hypothetical protein